MLADSIMRMSNKVQKCDVCQRTGYFFPRNHTLFHSINLTLPFEIWAINFVGLLPERDKQTSAKNIITTVEYLTKWVEA